MIRIGKYIHNSKEYSKQDKNNDFPRLYYCECCGYRGALHRHGFYKRNLITFFFFKKISIIRYKCPNKSCGKTYSVITDFIIPYHQYSFGAILFCLYLSYIKDKSTTSVEKFLKEKVSRQLVLQYKKRFQSQIGMLKMFFSSKGLATLNDSKIYEIKNILVALIHYLFSYNSFTVDFFKNTNRYFMEKPPA